MEWTHEENKVFKIRIGTIAKAGTFMVRNGFYYACKLHKGGPGLVVTMFTQSPFFTQKYASSRFFWRGRVI